MDSGSENAAAQYRLDKTKLLLGLEGLFLRTDKHTHAPRWLHVVAPTESKFWNKESTDFGDLSDHVDDKFKDLEAKFNDLKEQVMKNIGAESRQVSSPSSRLHIH